MPFSRGIFLTQGWNPGLPQCIFRPGRKRSPSAREDGGVSGVSYPWDSPGKNTGVGCHFLLQCTKVKSAPKITCKGWLLSPRQLPALLLPLLKQGVFSPLGVGVGVRQGPVACTGALPGLQPQAPVPSSKAQLPLSAAGVLPVRWTWVRAIWTGGQESSRKAWKDLPGGPVVKTSSFNVGGAGLIPGQGEEIRKVASWLVPYAERSRIPGPL